MNIIVCEIFLSIVCKTKATAKPNPNEKCLFPFTWKNKVYTACTIVDNNWKPWCATKSKFTETDGWGECDPELCRPGMSRFLGSL